MSYIHDPGPPNTDTKVARADNFKRDIIQTYIAMQLDIQSV